MIARKSFAVALAAVFLTAGVGSAFAAKTTTHKPATHHMAAKPRSGSMGGADNSADSLNAQSLQRTQTGQ